MGQNGPGCLAWETPECAREMLVEYVIQCQGKLVHVAHQLGYSRAHLYRLIKQHRLWPAVNKVREKRIRQERRERRLRGISNE